MWTEEKLNQYIVDRIEESLYLDYKASGSLVKTDGKKNEISKDISSFANSDGGIIIYGISEYQDGTKHLPEQIDPIDRNNFSKETLEQIINSRISPKIHGIIIYPVTIGNEDDNTVVYVVEIPKSQTAHQASDKRYYRRYNFQSIAMEDWEVKDIINRQNKANINITLRPQFDPKIFDTFVGIQGTKMGFDIIATNEGNKVVKYCDCMIIGNEVVSKTISPNPDLIRGRNYFELFYTNEVERKVELEGNEFVINTQRMPIAPHTYRKIGEITFYSNFFAEDFELRIIASLDDNRISKKSKGKNLMK